MGARGPKPKPTRLRVLEGNPGRLPINHGAPQPVGVPECPAYLSADARGKWADIMGSVPPGMIASCDGPLLEAFCEAWAVHKQATQALAAAAGGLAPDGRPSPYLRIRTEAARTMASLATRLGLSPADRNGLRLGQPKDGGRWGQLIG